MRMPINVSLWKGVALFLGGEALLVSFGMLFGVFYTYDHCSSEPCRVMYACADIPCDKKIPVSFRDEQKENMVRFWIVFLLLGVYPIWMWTEQKYKDMVWKRWFDKTWKLYPHSSTRCYDEVAQQVRYFQEWQTGNKELAMKKAEESFRIKDLMASGKAIEIEEVIE